MDRGGLDNALEGIVWVPLETLAEANRIAIVPFVNARPRSFPVRGLAELHNFATTKGCAPENRFVER